MKTAKYNSLLDDIPFSVPETTAEYDKLAGVVDACLKEGTDSVVWRSNLTDWRYHFLHGLDQATIDADRKLPELQRTFTDTAKPVKGVEEKSGIDRKTVQVLGKDGKPKMKDGQPVEVYDKDDSEKVFFKRVCATMVATKKAGTEDAAAEMFRADGVALAGYIRFNPAPRPAGEKGPKKLSEKLKVEAAKWLTGDKRDKFPKLQAVLKRDLGEEWKPVDGKGLDAVENVESLGWTLKRWEATQDAFAGIK